MRKFITVVALAFVLIGCTSGKTDDKVIRIGASPLPHADFLEQLEGPLRDLGYTLEVVTFDDYTIPNLQLEDGTLDANYFQHIPYLKNFNKVNGTDLVDVLKVHYEPIAIYSGKKTDLASVADGDIVFVPDDATNLPRALNLLDELGWIELGDNKETATLKDIVKYNVNIEIEEVQSEGIVPLINDGAYAVINGNYALASGITDRGLQKETISDDKIDAIANVIAVRSEDVSSEKTQAILKVFENETVKAYIATTFAPAITSVLGE